MKLGILGSGIVGQTLGAGFAAAGHQVMLGSREPKKLADWVSSTGHGVSAGDFSATAAFGEAIVFCPLGKASEDVIRQAGLGSFKGKLLLDATNPLEFSTGKPRLYTAAHDSLGEQIQALLPEAHVVKAFNTVGNAHMVSPKFKDGTPDMLIAGNDEGAKKKAAELCKQLGWDCIDMGTIEVSRQLESLCVLWCEYGIKYGTWHHAFKLLRG